MKAFSLTCPGVEDGGPFIVVIKAFLDDSSDQRQEKVVVYGGFLGQMSTWDSFATVWRKVLRESGISYFHSTEWRSLRGEFAGFRSKTKYPTPKGGRQAADAIRDRLKSVIATSQPKLVGVAVGVMVSDYREVLALPEAKGQLNSDSSEAAFQSVMSICAHGIRKIGRHNRILFVFDNSNKAAKLNAIYVKFKEKNPQAAKVIGGAPTMLDDKDQPPLQAADLMAHLAKDWLIEKLEKGEIPRRPRELPDNIARVAYWDRDYILAVLQGQSQNRSLLDC